MTNFRHSLGCRSIPAGGYAFFGEVTSLGPAVASPAATTGTEDPLVSAGVTFMTGSITRGKDVCLVVPSTNAQGSKATYSSPRFSHGHLIPLKCFQEIQKWEYLSMSELLPHNLELGCRASEA